MQAVNMENMGRRTKDLQSKMPPERVAFSFISVHTCHIVCIMR